MTREQLVREAALLPRSELIELAMDVWALAAPTDDDLPMTDELRAELDRRIAEDEADPTPAEPWDVLREKLLRGEI